MGILNMGL